MNQREPFRLIDRTTEAMNLLLEHGPIGFLAGTTILHRFRGRIDNICPACFTYVDDFRHLSMGRLWVTTMQPKAQQDFIF